MGWRTTQLCMEDIEKTYKDPYVFFFFELAELLQIADDVFLVLREELPEEFRDRVLDFWCARKTKREKGEKLPKTNIGVFWPSQFQVFLVVCFWEWSCCFDV